MLGHRPLATAALASFLGAAAASPTFQNVGSLQGSASAITVAWPTHAIDDIGLLVVATRTGQAGSLATPAGFAHVTGSPFDAAGTAMPQIAVYWCRATSAAMSSPITDDSGAYQVGVIITVRGCITTGDPWDVTSSGGNTTAGTSLSLPGLTTTVANTLVVMLAAGNLAAASPWVGAVTNADLTGIAERFDDGGASSASLFASTGLRSTAGTVGAGSATITSAKYVAFTLAMKPAAVSLASIVRQMMQYVG